MIEISITQTDREEPVFSVVLKDGNGRQTRHTVSMTDMYYDNLTHSKITKKELLEFSFKFLLGKESSSSILEDFDLEDIMRYYPDYDRAVRDFITRKY